MRKLIYLLCGLFLTAGLLGNTSCNQERPTARETNVVAQQDLMTRATQAVPVPRVSNFLNREAVAKQVTRLDEKGKLFYIYLFGDNGQQMGYFVAYTRPVATCSLLTPPDDVWKYGDTGRTSQALKAPGLGGVWNPGNCGPNYFFFDASTDAYIEFGDFKYFISDQPLSLKAEPIHVNTK
jgi:hypothetical protein